MSSFNSQFLELTVGKMKELTEEVKTEDKHRLAELNLQRCMRKFK